MYLTLTKASHLNSSYIDNDGQVLYKVETPFKFVGRVSTIKSALSEDIVGASGPSRINEASPYDPTSDDDVEGDVEYDAVPDDDDGIGGKDSDRESGEETRLQARFAHLAGIKFNVMTSSVIRYHGEEYETNKFFTKKERGALGRHRVFIGPDGLEYQWILGRWVPQLVRRDATRTPVARFHRGRLGIFKKRRRASLEIFPEGMHMIDLIMVTFVYIQKLRNDAESRLYAGGAHVVVYEGIFSGLCSFTHFCHQKATFVDKSLAIEAFLRDHGGHHLIAATRVHEFAFVFCGKFRAAAVRTLQRNSMEDWKEVAADSTVVSKSIMDMGDEGDEDEEA